VRETFAARPRRSPHFAKRLVRAMRLARFIIASTVAFTVVFVHAGELPGRFRGLHRDARLALERQDAFSCDTPAKTLPLTAVNDDYCDCDDGSDEPGTSACAGRSHQLPGFYCSNLGSAPKSIHLSMVDDGVCDCCDGSDEASRLARALSTPCENTCAKAAKARRNALIIALDVAQRGLKAKKKSLGDARALRNDWLEALAKAEAEVERERGALEGLRAARDEEERIERERMEVEREANEAKAREEEGKKAESMEGASGDDEAATTTKEPKTVEDEASGNIDATSANEDEVTEEDHREYDYEPAHGEDEHEETEEERGKRVASQWISDDSESTRGDDVESSNVQTVIDDVTVKTTSAPRAWLKASSSKVKSLLTRAKRALNRARGRAVDSSVHASDFPRTERDAFDAKQSIVRALEVKIDELKANIARDYGPEDVLLRLHGQCFETKIDKYVYKACPFADAHQDGTRLGTNTEGVTISQTREMTLRFTNGESCWNGPSRSLALALKCGDRETLSSVEEPSRCEYAAQLFTPHACDDDAVETLRNELAELDRSFARARDGTEL